MATNIDHTVINFENNATSIKTVKSDRSESERKKIALGDIKNSENNVTTMKTIKADCSETERQKCAFSKIINVPTLSASEEKVKSKEIETYDFDEPYEMYFSSANPGDYYEAWVEKRTFTDEEIDTWIRMLNKARDMNPYEEREPPIWEEPEDDFIPKELELDLEPVPIPEEPGQLDESIRSLNFNRNQMASQQDIYNDSELSALNRSVFELPSDFDESF